MSKAYVYYNYDSHGNAECIGNSKENNIFYKFNEFICSKCGRELMPFNNFCPECGNILPFGISASLLTGGEAFCDYTDYDSIEKNVEDILNKEDESIIIEKIIVFSKTYIQEKNNLVLVYK